MSVISSGRQLSSMNMAEVSLNKSALLDENFFGAWLTIGFLGLVALS